MRISVHVGVLSAALWAAVSCLTVARSLGAEIEKLPTAVGSFSNLGYSFHGVPLPSGEVGVHESGIVPMAPDLLFETRAYLLFDLTSFGSLVDTIAGASLRLSIASFESRGPVAALPCGTQSHPTEPFSVRQVTTSESDVLADYGNPGPSPGTPNPAGLAIFADLGDGDTFGSFAAGPGDVGGTIDVALGSTALAALRAAAGGTLLLGVRFAGVAFPGVQGQLGCPLVSQRIQLVQSSEAHTLRLTTVPVDRYRCYKARDLRKPPFREVLAVPLADQLVRDQVDVKRLVEICTPVGEQGEEVENPIAHLCCYRIKADALPRAVPVEVESEFQSSRAELRQSERLCVPCTKRLTN